MKAQNSLKLLFALLVLVCSACTENSGDDSPSDDNPSTPSIPGVGDSNFSSNCGTVVQERLFNPVSTTNGQLVSASVAGPNALIVSFTTGSQLVKLHGLKSGGVATRDAAAISTLRSLTSGNVWFFQSSANCSVTLPGGGQGVTGQFFTQQGVNFSERLIALGQTEVEADLCGGNLISTCYQALEDETRNQIGGQVSNFLWKPDSESNGSVVVLFNPRGSVQVGAEAFVFTGPSNGRSTTARGSRSGCAYGNNIRLDLRDPQGKRLVGPNGEDVVVPNGCSRFEF